VSASICIAAGAGGEHLFRGGKEKLLEGLENGKCFAGILIGLLRPVVLHVGALLGRDGIWIVRDADRQIGFGDFVHVHVSVPVENLLSWMR
jgi:hypothetical protein